MKSAQTGKYIPKNDFVLQDGEAGIGYIEDNKSFQ
jgi:hypothetical protein